MTEEFISEPLEPDAATFDTARMASGEPGLPQSFTWRGRTIRIVEVRRSWKDTGPCHHGSGEKYLRKHWYEVATEADGVLRIYFERQARGKRGTARWWLYSMSEE
ncbi:MAG: cytoplasmic protein [Kiritimatiellae bacterium]|nr:cytoplasmic protein [Kiritimatiellia bacterium]